MMARMVEGTDVLARKLQALRDMVPEALRPALVRAGEEIAADARALAESSRRTGGLIDSITVTGPGGTTPAHSGDGGPRTAGEFEVLITAGDGGARHAHLVEGGTAERHHKSGASTGVMPAAPFFNPAWRLNRARLQRRLNRLMRKIAREAVQ